MEPSPVVSPWVPDDCMITTLFEGLYMPLSCIMRHVGRKLAASTSMSSVESLKETKPMNKNAMHTPTSKMSHTHAQK